MALYEVGTYYDSNNQLTDVFVSGNYAYLTALEQHKLLIIDISDKTNPTLKGSVIDTTYMQNPRGVYVSGNYAYVTGNATHSLCIVDISIKTNPTVVGGLIDAVNFNGAFDVIVDGNYAYVSGNSSNSLAVIDISNKTNPSLSDSIIDDTQLDGIKRIVKSGNYVYVSAYDNNAMTVVNVSDPANISIEGSLSDMVNMRGSHGIDVSGNYVYVTGVNSCSFAIIDISDKANPSLSGSLIDTTDLSQSFGVWIDGNYAFVCDDGDIKTWKTAIIDITTKTAPVKYVPTYKSDTRKLPYNITGISNTRYIYIAAGRYISAQGWLIILKRIGGKCVISPVITGRGYSYTLGNIEYFLGSNNAKILKFKDEIYSDDEKLIRCYWQSKPIDSSEQYPELKNQLKTWDRINLKYKDLTTNTVIHCTISIDGGASWIPTNPVTVGTGDNTIKTTCFDFHETSEYLIIKIQHNSTNKDFRIIELQVEFTPRGDARLYS